VERLVKAAVAEMKKESTSVLSRDPEADMSLEEVRADIKTLLVTDRLIQMRLILLELKVTRFEFDNYTAGPGGHAIQ
jgi:hypothetical protein